MGNGVFICERRADAGGHARRLFDRLGHWFDDAAVFYDLDGIECCELFPGGTAQGPAEAAAILIVIGPDRFAELDRRADRPGVGLVRREVEGALAWRAPGEPDRGVLVLMGGPRFPRPVNSSDCGSASTDAPACRSSGRCLTAAAACSARTMPQAAHPSTPRSRRWRRPMQRASPMTRMPT